MICFITPTGGRPEGMELLAGYLNAQTYTGPALWIIVDDVNPITPLPESRFDVEVIRPFWRWQRGGNTQAKNMSRALAEVGDDDTVIIFEDDDVYLPDHITTTLQELETVELTGERVSRYYNVRMRRWQVITGKYHASLMSNGIRGEALGLLFKICLNSTNRIDMQLWQQFNGPKRLTIHTNCIGIKGLPGRAGIGIGHKNGFGEPDETGVLRHWIGDLAGAYEL